MLRVLWLVLFIPSICFANNIKMTNRPTLTFMGGTYRLVDFERNSVKSLEEYLPSGVMKEDFSKGIKRHEYYSVTDFDAAAQSKIWDLQERVGKFPHELVIDKDNKHAVLNAAYWWAPRPGALEKHVFVFKVNPKRNDVVAFEYHERHYIDGSDENIDALKAADKSLLLGLKYIDALKKLSDSVS